MKHKKIFLAIGPLILSLIVVVSLIFIPFKRTPSPSKSAIRDASSSMSPLVFRGNEIKNTAMSSSKYLPFFGSSELSRINAFHPSTIARKYKRNYEPFLLGAPGTQSLTHFFMLNSMSKELKNKPIVFIISPQWFVKEGVSNEIFSQYFSPLQTYQWLLSIDKPSTEAVYLANRLLEFSSLSDDTLIKPLLEKIGKGEALSELDRSFSQTQYDILTKEDQFFSTVDTTKEARILKAEKELPLLYDRDYLDKLAEKIGHRKTTTNPYQLENNFYKRRIKASEGKLKGAQKNYSYLASPEFSDFQAVLNQLAKNNTKALFIIPPVNKKWSDYTGLSQDMLKMFSQKISYQLQSQGFNDIVDFTVKSDVNYFMEDTIHLGWRGWLSLDDHLQEFLANKSQTQQNYHLNNEKFLSKEWDNQKKVPSE